MNKLSFVSLLKTFFVIFYVACFLTLFVRSWTLDWRDTLKLRWRVMWWHAGTEPLKSSWTGCITLKQVTFDPTHFVHSDLKSKRLTLFFYIVSFVDGSYYVLLYLVFCHSVLFFVQLMFGLLAASWLRCLQERCFSQAVTVSFLFPHFLNVSLDQRRAYSLMPC